MIKVRLPGEEGTREEKEGTRKEAPSGAPTDQDEEARMEVRRRRQEQEAYLESGGLRAETAKALAKKILAVGKEADGDSEGVGGRWHRIS